MKNTYIAAVKERFSRLFRKTENKKDKKPPEKRLFQKPITPKKIVIYVLLALLAVGLVFAVRFAYVVWLNPRAAFPVSTPRPPVITPNNDGVLTQPVETLSPEALLAQQADLDFMKDRVNILLAGVDYAPERAGDRTDFRTDTLMLLSVNFATDRVDIISVPRDSYANIAYTNRKWKINGAFMSAGGAEGQGFACMLETISTALGGIPIDYYFMFDMPSVIEIVDIIGGVWYDVDYDIQMDNRHLSAGYQLLDGQAALDYCRARKDITSGRDIDRIDRQQHFLIEMFKQLKKTKQLPKLPEIYNAVKSQVHTNLNFEQIAALAFFALDFDIDNNCTPYKLKGRYMAAYGSNGYYVLDHTYTKKIIEEIFGIEPDIDWTYNLNYVLADMAGRAFDEALLNVEKYYDKNASKLTELKTTVEKQISSAKKQRSELTKQLERAAKSRSYKKIDITDIEKETQKLEALYITLTTYKPPELKPSPSPTTSPSPTPSSSSNSPAPDMDDKDDDDDKNASGEPLSDEP